MAEIDWSQFRDNDKVRITLEGEWRDSRLYLSDRIWFGLSGTLKHANSAELIKKPWTPPPAGTLFKSPGGWVYQSLGFKGFRAIRNSIGSPVEKSESCWPDSRWLSDIEILDI